MLLWFIKLEDLSDKELIQKLLQKFSILEKEIADLKNEVRYLKEKLSRACRFYQEDIIRYLRIVSLKI